MQAVFRGKRAWGGFHNLVRGVLSVCICFCFGLSVTILLLVFVRLTIAMRTIGIRTATDTLFCVLHSIDLTFALPDQMNDVHRGTGPKLSRRHFGSLQQDKPIRKRLRLLSLSKEGGGAQRRRTISRRRGRQRSCFSRGCGRFERESSCGRNEPVRVLRRFGECRHAAGAKRKGCVSVYVCMCVRERVCECVSCVCVCACLIWSTVCWPETVRFAVAR